MTLDESQVAAFQGMVDRWQGTGELLADNMGIVVTECRAERVVGTMPVKGNRQPYGLLHGGASAVLAETLGSMAAAVNAPAGSLAVGVELNCTHHRSATEGIVTAVVTPLHTGRTMSSFEIVITDEAGRRICTSRLTCALRSAGSIPQV